MWPLAFSLVGSAVQLYRRKLVKPVPMVIQGFIGSIIVSLPVSDMKTVDISRKYNLEETLNDDEFIDGLYYKVSLMKRILDLKDNKITQTLDQSMEKK